MLCPPRWSCLSLVSGRVSHLVCHLGWDAVSASLVVSFSCLPSWLGCCVRLAGLVFLLSPILAGMLCPPRWSCLSLVAGLVSHLVCHLGWDAVSASLVLDAVSASLVLSFSCLPPCLQPWLGCCVRLAGLVFLLSPTLSPILAGMLCPPRWSCLSLVSHLVSHLGWYAVFAFLASLPARLVSHFVLQLVWDAVSVLWACLQGFMCDLCNCLGSTVVSFSSNYM